MEFFAAGVSSGGIALKHAGRIGEAAVYGAGCYAAGGFPGVAVSTTGVGEEVMQHLLAFRAAQTLVNSDEPEEALQTLLEEEFLHQSHPLNAIQARRFLGLAGVLAVRMRIDQENPSELFGDFLCAHTASSMGFGFVSSALDKPKAFISRLPNASQEGTVACIVAVPLKG